MIMLIVRIALTALAVGFLGWLGYVIFLGLAAFFGAKGKCSKASGQGSSDK